MPECGASLLEVRSHPLGHPPKALASVSSTLVEFPHPKTVHQIPRLCTRPPADWGLLASTILSLVEQAGTILLAGHGFFSNFRCASSAITTFALAAGLSATKGSPQGLSAREKWKREV